MLAPDIDGRHILDNRGKPRRVLKKAVQQGRSCEGAMRTLRT